MVVQRLSIWALLLVWCLILTACSGQGEKGTLSGKSKNWSATFEYQTKDSVNEQKLTIQYLGSDVVMVGNVTYTLLDHGKVLGKKNIMLPDDGKYVTSSFSQKTSDEETQKELTLQIEWNNRKEVILLKSLN
jgi:hypothetical protein